MSRGTAHRGIIPAPTMGWNTRDSLSAMRSQYAVVLDNYFPEHGVVRLRRGSVEHATGLSATDAVETLFVWRSGATEKLFAICDGSIYDVTASAESYSAETGVVAITNSAFRGVNFNGYGILTNGSDAPLAINAAGEWVAHGFTASGLDAANLEQVAVFKNRLFFTERNTANLWYGEINAVTGPLSKINLGLVNAAGGNCIAIGSLTLDSGIGVDDFLVIFMHSGDALVYRGTDPSNAANWALVGRFHIGRVVGKNPLVKLGGDLIAITPDGFVPLLGFLRVGRAQTQLAISDAIAPSITEAARESAGSAGWGGVLYSDANWLLFNIPANTAAGESVQFVQNTQTGAWCRFTGLDARCWAVSSEGIFFGAPGGKVWKADVDQVGEDHSIAGEIATAFTRLRTPADKQFRMIRAHVESQQAASFQLLTRVDYSRQVSVASQAMTAATGSKWDEAEWDEAKWGRRETRFRNWTGVNTTGSSLSLSLLSRTQNQRVEFYGADVLFDIVGGSVNIGGNAEA